MENNKLFIKGGKFIPKFIQNIIKYIFMKGKIERDTSKPNGTPKKLLDVSKLRELGWKYSISLDEGIESVYEWFLNNKL